MLTVILGRVLRARRRQLGWSQGRAASEAGVSRQAIVLVEKGDRNPQISTIETIATGLRMSIQDLLEQAAWVAQRVSPDTKALGQYVDWIIAVDEEGGGR